MKRYLIYGLSKSGKSALKLIYNKKDFFYLYDYDEQVRLNFEEDLINKANVFLLNEINKKTINFIDEIILSPGVSIYNEHIVYAKKRQIQVTSELELGFRNCKNKLIAITGTNGKTTTVSLLYDILKLSGKKVEKVGNIGCPLSEKVKNVKRNTIFICEVSSFQLEAIKTFKPNITAILNITPDHLNRHKSFLNYKNTKLKILKNLKQKNKIVLNENLKINKKHNTFTFGFNETKKGCFVKENAIYFLNNKNEEKICLLNDLPLKGSHNVENVMAAICLAKILKIKTKYIQKAVKNFKNISHRIEKVFEVSNKSFYDDSKATNIDSTIKAINSFSEPTILILGGSDKGYEYDEIFLKVPKNIISIYACGEVAKKIEMSAKRNNCNLVKVFPTLKEATIKACENLKENQNLLLSPASASFDEFLNYKDRGEKFLSYIKDFYEQNKK